MGDTITWLHLSDLHLCDPTTGWDAAAPVTALFDDLTLMQAEYGLKPDLIFFTGDAAFGQLADTGGKSLDEQYAKVHDFLERLRTHFSPVVPQENVFLVPGNHDVNRKKALSPALALWLDSCRNPEEIHKQMQEFDEDNDFARCMHRLRNYREFLDRYGYTHLLHGRDHLVYATVREPDYPYPHLFRVTEASLEALTEQERRCYLDLAVFPEDVAIPEAAATTLWASRGCSGADARDLAETLVRLSLVQRAAGGFRLHDLQMDYVRTATAGQIQSLHGRLVDAYKAVCKDGWHTGPDDGYFFQRLPWHMKEAGLEEELGNLLFGFPWLAAKLAATDPMALVADCELSGTDEELSLLGDTIRLSAHILRQDRFQLASQFCGRLEPQMGPGIAHLVAQASAWRERPWMRPLVPTLTRAGGPLRATFAGHTGSVNAVAVLPDGKQALSGSDDKTLKLWDLQTGRVLRSSEGHTGPVQAEAVLADGKQVLSASSPDSALNLWDLASGRALATFIGEAGMLCCAAAPDGRTVVAGDKGGRMYFLRIEGLD